MTDFLCTLKKEGPGYSLELSFDSTKSALDAALEILSLADADCYLARRPKEKPKTTTTPQDEYEMPIRHLLRDFRKANGLTQEELGRLLKFSKQSICCWECGTKNPSHKTELAIREKLRKGVFTHV